MRRHASAMNQQDEPVAKVARIISKNIKVKLSLPTRLEQSGSLLSCGQNEVGQLGFNDDIPEKTRPALLDSVKNVVDVQAGGMHSLCLTESGDLYSFGCNDEGALGRDTSEEGSEYVPSKINLPGKCIKFSAGDSHSACLLEDGRVLAWGSFRDSHGNMGLTLEGNKHFPFEVLPELSFIDIVSGTDHLVMLTDTGKVYTIGCAEQGQLGRISARSSSGESRRGKTQHLQPGVVHFKKTKIIDAIWASAFCTFARDMQTSEIYAFGLNNYSQLGVNIHSDTVFVPTLSKFKNVNSITGGQHHTIILTNDGKCYAIGRKEYGRLGVGEIKEDLEELTIIPALTDKNIIQISCGESCSFALSKDGKVFAWGMGTNNQLGVGSDEDVYEPTLLTGLQVKNKHVLTVSSGGQHSLFVVSAPTSNGLDKSDGKKK